MLRTHVVKTLLVEEIAGLTHGRPGHERPPDDERAEREWELLDRARRRALAMVAVSWLVILVLFLFHPATETLLSFKGDETPFTLGILLLAVFSGFRLGQWEKYRTVARIYAEISERE